MKCAWRSEAGACESDAAYGSIYCRRHNTGLSFGSTTVGFMIPAAAESGPSHRDTEPAPAVAEREPRGEDDQGG